MFKLRHMPGPECTLALRYTPFHFPFNIANRSYVSGSCCMRRASNRWTQPLCRAAFLCSAVLMCIATTRLLRQVPLIRQRSQVRAMAKYSYEWPRPALTVDAVIVAKPAGSTPSQLLLIQRKHPPCKGQWALPGGFVDQGEPLHAAAARELQEETSVDPKDVDMFQVGSYGDPGRDPRGWTVTVAYAAVVPSTELGVKAADDAAAARWYPVNSLPSLAFDHKQIIREAFQKLLDRPEVQQTEAMIPQLKEGGKVLEGPWTPPKE